MKSLKLLIVEDDPLFGEAVMDTVEEAGYRVVLATTGARALEAASEQGFDLVLQDVKLPDVNGLEVLEEILRRQPGCKALVMTGHATVDRAVEAMKLGAGDFLTKPFPPEFLLMKLEKALKLREMENELDALKKQASVREAMVSRSPAMRQVMETVQAVAPTDSTVLIQGESGTGKELLADAIHRLSGRARKPIVKVNCAAIPETLVESELFGVERGAFTGADRSRPGYLERASGGTLFLDEIGEMPLQLQGKLLRVLEEKVVYRLGGTQGFRADFRLVAATNRNLREMTEEKTFREDLYFRLNVVPVQVPPLRERREDIPLLIVHFRDQLAATGKGVRFSQEAIDALCRYDFPGNIRQLANLVEQLSILYPDEEIKKRHIPSLRSSSLVGNLFEQFPVGKPLKSAVVEFEHRYIEKVIKSTGGNRTRAASVLGLSRKVLWEKLKKYGEE